MLNWKGYGTNQSLPVSRYYEDICQVGPKKKKTPKKTSE
jgi:hypothetical protein